MTSPASIPHPAAAGPETPFDYVGMFEQLAENGTAPAEGCRLFGVGYEQAFERLRQKYLVERFSRGRSAEKFVTGPTGSGKTHFLRQLMEIARDEDCVTAEVKLSKDLDFTNALLVYQETCREVRAPGYPASGMRALLSACVDRVRMRAERTGLSGEEVCSAWAAGLPDAGLELEAFGRTARTAVLARLEGDEQQFQIGCRWLGGEVTEKSLARELGESTVESAGQRVFARRARLSLFQLIRSAGFRGTVVGFDEAEQGIATDKARMAKIFSHLLSEINEINDLEKGAALILYAITPDIIEKITERLPPLASRLADAGPDFNFFSGTTTAPRIDLTNRTDPQRELERIGERLATLFFDHVPGAPAAQRDALVAAIAGIAADVNAREPSSSARRTMVKLTSARLISVHEENGTAVGMTRSPRHEPEV